MAIGRRGAVAGKVLDAGNDVRSGQGLDGRPRHLGHLCGVSAVRAPGSRDEARARPEVGDWCEVEVEAEEPKLRGQRACHVARECDVVLGADVARHRNSRDRRSNGHLNSFVLFVTSVGHLHPRCLSRRDALDLTAFLVGGDEWCDVPLVLGRLDERLNLRGQRDHVHRPARLVGRERSRFDGLRSTPPILLAANPSRRVPMLGGELASATSS